MGVFEKTPILPHTSPPKKTSQKLIDLIVKLSLRLERFFCAERRTLIKNNQFLKRFSGGALGGCFFSKAPSQQNHHLMAAAGDEKESDDKDPDPVIVEKSAKAVVIHKISSLGDMCKIENAVLTIILCGSV